MKCLYPIAKNNVYVFSLEPIDSRMYCIINAENALVIDPCLSTKAKKFLSQRKLQHITILLTHEHIDHISGVNMLRNLTECEVICSTKCAERISDSRKNAAAYMEGMYAMRSKEELEQIQALNLLNYTCYADKTFDKEVIFKWHDLQIKCIEMPGHSPGGMVIVINDKYIFSGDNYIPGIKVITKLPGGNKKEYEDHVKPFFNNLNSGSIIYPGHGEAVKL